MARNRPLQKDTMTQKGEKLPTTLRSPMSSYTQLIFICFGGLNGIAVQVVPDMVRGVHPDLSLRWCLKLAVPSEKASFRK